MDQLVGPWRPAPVTPSDDAVEAVRSACAAAPTDPSAFGLANQPVVAADARGEGIVTVVLADEAAAYVCRARLVAGASSATVIDGPARLDPASLRSLEEYAISVVDHVSVDEVGPAASLLVGRIGPEASRVVVGFDDDSEVVATKSAGWYLAWWPGAARPRAIASVDRQGIPQASAPDPAADISGRVAPAGWWVDPVAAPTEASTTISGFVLEQVCASGRSPEGRVLDPAIFYGDDGVLVTFFIRRLPGGQDCPGNPPFPVTFTLSEPLGDRKLLDGSEVPPGDTTVQAP